LTQLTLAVATGRSEMSCMTMQDAAEPSGLGLSSRPSYARLDKRRPLILCVEDN